MIIVKQDGTIQQLQDDSVINAMQAFLKGREERRTGESNRAVQAAQVNQINQITAFADQSVKVAQLTNYMKELDSNLSPQEWNDKAVHFTRRLGLPFSVVEAYLKK